MKKSSEPTDKGVPLAPSEKDLKPWYSDKDHERNRDLEDDRKYVSALPVAVSIETLTYNILDYGI